MPLLPLEPFVFPDNLLTQAAISESELGNWWVLHTRPRSEKSLVRRLLRRQVPFFLPLSKRKWRNRGRVHSSYLPLFPGYVFLRSDGPTAFRALETNLVARILDVPDQEQLQADLARIYSLIAAGAPLAAEDRLCPGSRVEIISGPFTGLEGKVLRRGKQLKLIVEVRFLQQGVSVEIESWMVEAAQGGPKNSRGWPVKQSPARVSPSEMRTVCTC
jgi:transcription antitermination factor NusG